MHFCISLYLYFSRFRVSHLTVLGYSKTTEVLASVVLFLVEISEIEPLTA